VSAPNCAWAVAIALRADYQPQRGFDACAIFRVEEKSPANLRFFAQLSENRGIN